MNIKVLYEDNHLIAVLKPVGILAQGDRSGDINLLDEVKKYLKDKYKKPGNVFLGLLHRLDRPVSGIILFAKTSKGAARISEQFRNRLIKKTYHAIVMSEPKQKKGELINFLEKNRNKRKAILASSGPNVAELSYETVLTTEKYSLLKINIKTGKFHQIRAQLSTAGYPILGDIKYGAPFPLNDKSIALSATGLSFQTATTKEKINLSIPIPDNWNEYLKQKRQAL